MMKKQQIKMERSPFHKYRDNVAPRNSNNLQAQVSDDIYKEFINYAIGYNAQHKIPKTQKGSVNKSTPLKHVIEEFLNNNALTRQNFSHLHVIIAFNKIDFENIYDMNVEGVVIGFVEHAHKFTKFKSFQSLRGYYTNKSNVLYSLEPFDKITFNNLNLNSFDREVLFDIDPSLHDDFDAVREHLQDLYEHIDFDNAEICMFNLNNYFDIMNDGVFVSEQSKYKHDGFVVLLNPDDMYMQDRIVARINWSYAAGELSFNFDVVDLGFFNETLIHRAHPQAALDYWSISSGFLDLKADLHVRLNNSNKRIKELEKRIAEEKQRNADIQKRIENIDSE